MATEENRLKGKTYESAEEAIQAVLHSDYPQHLIEIIEVTGESPSKQRNMGAGAAHGDILYFLDSDSIITPTLFSRVVRYYTGKTHNHSDHLAGVGGPNLTPKTDGFWQKVSGHALSSPFAHLKMSARYKPVGTLRYSGEQELILCNLSICRDIFLRENGFNESMYPNEENEFINRLVNKGYRFLYDPDAIIYRSRRKHVWAFIRQLFHYGGGRANQIRIEGLSLKSLLFFLPLGLLVYLLALPLLSIGGKGAWWMFLPLILYILLAMLSAFHSAMQERNPLFVLILPVWYLLMHVSYGVGLFWRFFKPENSSKDESQKASQAVQVIVRKSLG